MKYILSTFILTIILISCAKTKDMNSNKNTNDNSAFKNVAKDDSLFASIRRGACYGKCPMYEIKIYNSGVAELKGSGNIDLIGDYKTRISKETMMSLLDKAKSIGYQNMEDVYDNEMITDLPETKTSIVIDGKQKSIRRRVNFPMEILGFEEMFDLLLKSEKWTKVETVEK